MKQLKHILSILGAIFLISGCDKEVYSLVDCDSPIELLGQNDNWELFLSGDTTVPSFPDAYVNYFSFSLVVQDSMGIQIEGEFPEARYMSINVYESNQGTTLNEVYDLQINPDHCSYNPFMEIEPDNTTNRYFTINVLPTGTITDDSENILFYPDNIDSLSIFIRCYDTDGNEFGGVELPYVYIYNSVTQEEILNPNIYTLRDVTEDGRFDDILLPLFPFLQLSNTIRFYKFSTENFFSNYNTSYLAAGITKDLDEVYMIRFKPPIIPEALSDYPNSQSRYWSINQGNEDTQTFMGWKDHQFIIAESDSFVNIVIADPTDEIIQHSEGLNFLPWSIPGEYMTIIYRNVLQSPDFSGNFNQVPTLSRESLGGLQDLYDLNAYNFIGDFAPVGLRMSVEDYLLDFGGFPVSY